MYSAWSHDHMVCCGCKKINLLIQKTQPGRAAQQKDSLHENSWMNTNHFGEKSHHYNGINCGPTPAIAFSLQWHHNERDGISNHQPHDRLLKSLFRPRSRKTSKLHVTCLSEGNSPVTGEFPTKRASNAEKVSISQRHHVMLAEAVMPMSFCEGYKETGSPVQRYPL